MQTDLTFFKSQGNAGKRFAWHFTLIELLVVIAVIAILASLMLPAFNNARATAKGSLCASNFRQFGMAFASYSNDWNGFFPALNSGSSWALRNLKGWWGNQLAQGGYIKVDQWGSGVYNEDYGSCTSGIWRCPSFTDSMIVWGGGAGIIESAAHAFSYGKYPRPSLYRRASQVLCMTDCWSSANHTSLITSKCPVCAPWDGSTNESAAVHGGGKNSNTLYFDSHVESVKYLVLKANYGDIFGHNTR